MSKVYIPNVTTWSAVLDVLKANSCNLSKQDDIKQAIEPFKNTIRTPDLYNLIANIDQKVRLAIVLFAFDQIKELEELVGILADLKEEDRLAAFDHCFSEKIGINDADDLQYILHVIPTESRSKFTKRFIDKIENIQVFAGQILPKIPQAERLEIALLCTHLITTPEALHLVSHSLSSEEEKIVLKEQVNVTEPNIARRLYTYFKPAQTAVQAPTQQQKVFPCQLL